MPNEFDTNKNQLDLFSYAESKQNQQDKRQKLASSGFTATVWTLSGVVLAACSLFQDDEGGAGGGSVSVNASPVRDARLYFDIDGDGDVDEEDVRIQNEQYPGGFTTDADGRATGIPIELLGRPYIADLNGAVDDATEHPLEGQYSSLQDEDGNHLIASPITALIAEAMADTNQPNTVSGVVAAFTPSGVDATELLEELRSRDSYLPGTESSERVIALSKYLADNKAREVVGREDTIAEQIAESQRIIEAVETGLDPANTDAIVVVNEDTDGATPGVQLATITIGEHDSYVGIINAFAQDGSALTYTLTNQDGTATDAYTIDDRGGIRVADDSVTPTNMGGTFNVVISDGNGNEETVEVTIMVDVDVYELSLEEGREVGDIDENILGSAADPLITGIEVDDATVNMPDYFTIRDNALGVFADKFEMEFDTTNQAWNLVLKDTEYLDYEAIPGGEFELYVSVRNDATADMGEHSNILTITVTVNDDPDDISFSGTLRADLREDDTTPPSTHLIAEGQVQIANQDLGGSIQPVVLSSTLLSTGMPAPASGTTVETLTLDHGTFTYNHADNTWTYTVNNDATAIQELVFGQATTEIVTLTIADPTDPDITYTQSIVLNVHGANEDVRFEDANDARTSVANVPDAMNIEIGDETALNGSFALGNVLTDLGVTLEGRLSESETTTVAFADSVDAELRRIFELDANDPLPFALTEGGDLTFTGTNANALTHNIGTISLRVLVSTESTADDIPLTVRVNIVNEVDNDGAGSAIYEIDGDTSAEGNLLTAQIAPGGADVDGVMAGSERYQWYRGDDAANGVLVGSGSTYTVQTDDVDETITLIVNYTDGSGTPETSEAATTPVRITRPTAAELEFAENDGTASLTLTATSSDDTNPSVAISTFMFVYTDQQGQEQEASDYQGFSINSINNQGVITLTGGTALDYETASSYDLRIRATDANGEVGHLSITITVGDVNDNDPAFEQATYTTAIDETLAPGASVISVRATDDDGTTANSDVRYSIISGNTGNVFEINERTGAITVAAGADLDFETTPSYTLMIGASDGLNASGTADQTFTADDTATVTITLSDVNDITPTYMVTAGENSASVRGTEAGGNSADVGTGYRITITDADTTNTFRGNFDVSDRRFDFVETSAGSGVWELTLLANEAVALSETSLTITYQVYDGTNTAAGGRGSVTVAVVDSTVTYTATQNAPLEIAEADNIDTTTLGTGGVLAQVTAESSESQTVTYTLTSAVDQNGADVSSLFTVDGDDGEVRFTDSTVNLDYEAVSEYSLVITASAQQSATTTDTDDVPTTVIIRVINEQEGDGTYIVRGNVAAGAELTAVVTDPDGTRSVTYEWYSIDPADNNARTVLGTTQSITLPGAADFDDSLTYHVDIVHIDNLGDRHEETLDASAVVFEFQDTTGNAFPSSIVENTDSLPVVVATLDGDTRSPTYTFVGGDTITTSGVFTISQSGSTAGAITVNAPSDINFETAQEFNDGSRGYTLNVRATFAEDTANNLPEVTGDVVVTIIVTDVNEHAPVFTPGQTVTATIPESQTAADGTILTITASDLDGSDENKDLTYSIVSGNTGNAFFIDPSSGEIRVADGVDLNYDVTTADPTPTRSYTLMIGVTDGLDDTGATDTTADAMLEVTITITDANDNDPVLGAPVWRSTYETSVPEDTGSGVHLFTVTATDADTATTPPPTLTYRIVTIDDVAYDSATAIFGINGSNGEVGIALDNALDRETKASHKIVIEAFDEGVRTSNQQTVIVTVGDVNEHKPVLGEPEWVSDYGDNGVPEDAYTGAPLQIFTATATDRDATNNGFSYEIVSVDGVTYDSSTSIFAIRAGRVGITSALDYATAPEIMDDTGTVIGRGHEIVIVAIDNSGTGMRSEPGTVTVLVANRDDGPAVFEVSPTQANKDILEVEVDTADPDGLDGTYSYQWFTTTDDGVTQVDITGANGRRFDTTGRTDPTGTVIGVRVEYTDNAGTEYSQANGNAPFAVNTTLRFTESYSITLTDGDASPTLPVFADDLELNGDAITTGLEFTFATNGNPGNLFTLSPAGVLTFTGSAVDFDMATDAEKSFNLIIVAEAMAGGETTTAIIPVTVEDVNDNDPTLSEPFDTASAANDPRTALSADDIDENATGAATSISFTASDADTVFSGAGQTELEFTITATAGTTDAQDIADMFEMAYDSTNDIYTLRLKDGMALNAEAAGLTTNSGVQQIELRIQATDGRTDMPTATPTAGQGLSDARTVTITVNDINEFGPVFTDVNNRDGDDNGATLTLVPTPENTPSGPTTTLTLVNPASDGDATTRHNTITYSIVDVSGAPRADEFFNVNSGTGQITLAQDFDYETTPLLPGGTTERGYVIELLAEDGGGMQARQMITVVVGDVDDTPSEFGTLAWQEGTGSGVAGEEHIRTINENTTGTLLTIPISDSDTAGGTLAVRIVSGNSVEGGEDLFVFAKNTANTAAELSINPNRVLNYEDGTTYTLVLEVSDGTNTPAATQTVTINVNNLNDETPAFADPVVTWEAGFTGGVIPESTDGSTTRVLVGRVAITDGDGTAFLGDRTFAINGAGSKFVIERDTTTGEGLIYLNAALDIDDRVSGDPAQITGVTITVNDGVNPAVTSTAFDIEISDVNEHDPVISPGAVVWSDPTVTSGAINEGSYSAGTTIAFATVTDADATNPAPLRYTLTKGGTIFSISNTGVITFTADTDLDADTAPTSYTLAYTVQNVIGGNPVGNPVASGDITLTVTDVNESPAFGSPLVTFETGFSNGIIPEDTDVGDVIGVVNVSDDDGDTLTVTVLGGMDATADTTAKFEVVYNTTDTQYELKLKTALELEGTDADPSSFGLRLQVSDGTNPDVETPAALNQQIAISIAPVDDERPVFGDPLHSWLTGFGNGVVPEDTDVGTAIAEINVSDADTDADDLTVTVLAGLSATQDLADKFEVVYNASETRFELRLAEALNLEGADPDPTGVFGLRLQVDDDTTDAIDAVESPTANNKQIGIQIRNVDDEKPVLDADSITWDTSNVNVSEVDANTLRVYEFVTVDGRTSGPPASTKLATLMATDPDNLGASITYTVDNGPTIGTAQIFTIENGNELTLNTALDYEDANIDIFRDADNNEIARGYTLTLTATKSGKTDDHEIVIHVANFEDGKAGFAPLTSSGSLSAPAVGDTLTFNPTPTTSDGDGDPDAGYTPIWYRADDSSRTGFTRISNTGNTYKLQTADVGKIVGVAIEYTDKSGIEYTGDEGVFVELANVVASDFSVTGGAMGTAEQYDTSPVDATGTLTFGTESAMDVDSTGTYTIASQGTYGTVSLVPVNSDMSMGPIVTPGTWAYNVNNAHAAVKALRASDTTPLTDTFKIGVPLTAAAGGGVQEVTVTVDISGVATGAEIHGTSSANTGRAPGNPLDRATATAFEVIQGGNGNDEIWAGSGGSLVIGGYGNDNIMLGDGADTVVYRFASITQSAGWRSDDGGDEIHDFELGKDKIVFVDTDGSPVTLTQFLTQSVSLDVGKMVLQASINLAASTIQGFTLFLPAVSDDNGPDTTGGMETKPQLVFRFKEEVTQTQAEGALWDASGFANSVNTATGELEDYTFLSGWFSGEQHDAVDPFQGLDVIALADLEIDIV